MNSAIPRNHSADIVILGGGTGGCAAALAILENGFSVIMTEEFEWIGGQFTSQAVPPDEHGWIESFGCTARYRQFREQIRNVYRQYYPLLPQYRDEPRLNPGNGWVSPLCHEPRVALSVLQRMLQPYLSSGRLLLLTRCELLSIRKDDDDHVHSAIVRTVRGEATELRGKYFLDATENGDALPLAEMEYVSGSESRAMTNEPSASESYRPGNVQSISVCFVLDETDDKNNIAAPPEGYEYWRNYEPKLTPPWPGKLLSWNGLNPRTMQTMHYNFNPHREKPGLFSGLWAFRRIIDRAQFMEGIFPSDLCLVNWPMIDYMEADILSCSQEERHRHIEAARQLSLSMVYWLQTEAPRPDGGKGWPGLRLRGDITGTPHGLAMAPYIRESRRIVAKQTIVEQDVSAQCRPNDMLAERYEDSIGLGYYRIDLHPSTGGDNYIDVPSQPFRIPLGALVPMRMQNLLPAAKNIGTTHITNGCYRLHPVEWNIGEAAGLLVIYCLRNNTTPEKVHASRDLFRKFQISIIEQGIETAWPEGLNLDDGDPHAHAR
ncbi:FAD-dependent oxidoreductase [Edaphobacter albus]|uniref:FAD-dependent oxidoreductase n=1 Tax=Edaphobacter sp. 4G125 TaxID=2763071 RepID=UPI001647355D|nr:FAD-dependent oxidoreductase [Edaphobacter sp. 4G125]QNI35751.1 FAD-dependent oxidoreductase [Edaphobacter sp. 4G125]